MNDLANVSAPPELARFIDAQGHRVTAEIARSGLCVILARTSDGGLRSGHPALNQEHARVLGMALLAFADGTGPETGTA